MLRWALGREDVWTFYATWSAERMGGLLTLYADGRVTTVSEDITRVTGAPARGFERFAQDHLAAFAA